MGILGGHRLRHYKFFLCHGYKYMLRHAYKSMMLNCCKFIVLHAYKCIMLIIEKFMIFQMLMAIQKLLNPKAARRLSPLLHRTLVAWGAYADSRHGFDAV
jgi:hypothetical protein